MYIIKALALALAVTTMGHVATATAQAVTGEVVKIEAERGRITLKHGPIPNLDMDGMTMVFRVADPAMLQQVREGDRVRFDADRVNGNITITRIQRAR
ncbi:copper-binding protein [Phreatobacter stygius]|uniref:Copper-binding protein n=1 Tax=Phreatobacter stygius TaxID=1940610 RepID=A0A4D7BDH4_9HYPH|nr:copper-binding protein [Phreatobacter stygius]